MSNKKKVLIISYYWPPAGGPGVQRWLKFVKYLPEFDIEPIVYIPENPTYPIIDQALLNEVSPGITLLKYPIVEPYGFATLFSAKKTKKISSGLLPVAKKQTFLERCMLWVRGNIFIPDARFLWVDPSVKFLTSYLQNNPVDLVVTTGPPHSLHLIGLKLKQQTACTWLADFRDPWTTIGYYKALKLSGYADRKHRALEKKVLQTADQILVTSPTTAAEFSAITQRPIQVITNGYDTEQVPKTTKDACFSLAHIGSLLLDRNPLVLWRALRSLTQENESFSAAFKLKLIGAVSPEVLQTIHEMELSEYLEMPGYIPHNEALVQQRSSQVLLLIEIDHTETRCILPGKLFEYMVSGCPILAFGPEQSDMEPIIRSTNTGQFYPYSAQEETIKTQILHWFNEFQLGTLQSNGVGLQHYHRKALTAELSKLIFAITQ
ncbi:MAG: glycosyl transferase family 1 [Flavobacterium sp. BFFFF2]|nr:MAG: glycosyl transferase family 1 [Flavobacterium sp. BFFFF2]